MTSKNVNEFKNLSNLIEKYKNNTKQNETMLKFDMYCKAIRPFYYSFSRSMGFKTLHVYTAIISLKKSNLKYRLMRNYMQ